MIQIKSPATFVLSKKQEWNSSDYADKVGFSLISPVYLTKSISSARVDIYR